VPPDSTVFAVKSFDLEQGRREDDGDLGVWRTAVKAQRGLHEIEPIIGSAE
jgi:hypothetical protein